MATKVVYTIREDKQELHKQLGCMNGIFQLFDRRYLLGLHRHGQNQKKLSSGQGENGEKEFKNSSEQAKEKKPKKVTIEKNRASIESSRNSFSSSCSSTTFSSLDCSKRLQTEWQLPSEPTSPNLHKKQQDWSTDIRNVVKHSMTREIRVEKDERADLIKHVDSPRPFIRQRSVQYDRKDRNLPKVPETSSGVKKVKETSRFSCDERESRYSLTSTLKVKEPPRLSLDSKQDSKGGPTNKSKTTSSQTVNQAHEPGSNKRQSSGVVARLMGLESLTDSVHEVETLKKNEDPVRAKSGTRSVYGEMEKRLNGLEFKTSTKNLRALKQILEAMQTKKVEALEIQKTGRPVSSPRAMNPATTTADSKVITGLKNVNGSDSRKDYLTRKRGKDSSSRNQKAIGRAPPSNSPEYRTVERPVLRSKLQRSKNGVHKQCFNGPSSDLRRIKKESNVKPVILDLKTKNQKPKPVNKMQNNEQSSIETRRRSQDGDTVSFRSESDTSLSSKSKLEVMRNDRPKENHSVNENNFAERLIEDKATTELTKLTMEQPSPVSVLDAFYTENTPSPVKNKPNAFNDYENSHFDEAERNQAEIYNNTDTDHYSEFNHVKLENGNYLIHQIQLLNSTDDEATAESPCEITNGDHRYIGEILLASGFLKDLDSATRIVQLHPTVSLIKPDLFHLLEKIRDDECNKKNPRAKSNEKIRRLMIFDSVNDILFHKLAMLGSCGLWTGRKRVGLLNGEKILQELCSEIDHLQNSSNRCLYDEDDEVKDIVSEEVNKNSEDWDKCCYGVPGLVLDIERLIFKDLIDEVVNAELGKR